MDALAVRSDTQVQTQVISTEELPTSTSPPVLRLRLKKPKSDRKVVWREGTIDNEHMNKKKSKCCCIYKKPLSFGESSSDDDRECEHCYGHPEKRKKYRKKKEDHSGGSSPDSSPDDKHHDHEHGDDCEGAVGGSVN